MKREDARRQAEERMTDLIAKGLDTISFEEWSDEYSDSCILPLPEPEENRNEH